MAAGTASWVDVQVAEITRQIAAGGEYVTHAAVMHELARRSGPYGLPAAALYQEPSLALLARLQETVDGFVAAFVDSRSIATVRDLEEELPVVLRSFNLPPLAPPSPSGDPDEIDLDDGGSPQPVGGGGSRALDVAVGEDGPPTFEEYGLGPLLAHPLVRMHWRLARGPRPLVVSLSASDVLHRMREDSVKGKLPAEVTSERFGAHLCAAYGVADTRALGVILRDVRPMLLLARHAWRVEQEQLARAFNTGQRLAQLQQAQLGDEPRAAGRGKRSRVSLKPPPQPEIGAFLLACERALDLGPRSPSLSQVRAIVASALRDAAEAETKGGAARAGGGDGAGLDGKGRTSKRAASTASGDAPSGAVTLRVPQMELCLSVLTEYAMLHLGGRKHRAKRFQADEDEGDEAEAAEAEAEAGLAGARAEGARKGVVAPAAGAEEAERRGDAAANGAVLVAADHDRAASGEAVVGSPARKRAHKAEGREAAPVPPLPLLLAGTTAAQGALAPRAAGSSTAEMADGFRMVVERPHGGGPRHISNEQLRPCLPFCAPDCPRAGAASGCGVGSARAEEQMREAGRWGEALVYQYLLLTHAGGSVRWLNERAESGLGYDIELRTEGGRLIFVEVKSTRHARKNVFQISSREWELARKMGEGFHLYRVYAALDPALVCVDHVVDPARMLESGQVALCLAV